METPVEAVVEEVADRETVAVETEPDRGDRESAAQESAGLLIGLFWVLKSLGPADSPDAVVTGSTVTAVFSEDGSLKGNGGCNSYSGSYRAEGGSISLDPGGVHRDGLLGP